MASASYIKDISSGFGEYFSDGDSISTGEFVEFEFNSEITIDDIIVVMSNLTTNDKLQLYIEYPSSGMQGVIATFNAPNSSDIEYFLNSTTDLAEGHLGTGRNWYRIPARSKLGLNAISVNAGVSVELTVIGRGG